MATFTGQLGVAADYIQPGLAPVLTVVVVVPPVVTSGLRTGGVIVRTRCVVVG